MSDRVAFLEGRAFPRLALTGLALLWLSGCSSDIARFDAPNPFANPFGSQTAEAAPAGPAPSGHVAAAPLAPAQSVASAAAPQPHQAVGGSAAGWTAVGGSPVVVAKGENLDTLSTRYGVPTAALLSANGLSSAADVKDGMHIVVPVYNSGGRAVAAAKGGKTVADASAKPAKKHAEDLAANEGAKPKKAREASAKKDQEKVAEKAKAQDKPADAKGATTVVAKAEPAKPSTTGKKPAIDDAPTGNVDPKAAGSKAPVTGDEADASGGTPEFRWPARGRIIEGFKAGGLYDVIFVNGAIESQPDMLLSQLEEGGRLVAFLQSGAQGRATLYLKEHGRVGHRADFDANVPLLAGFKKHVGFVF